jgi:hypothetical protein
MGEVYRARDARLNRDVLDQTGTAHGFDTDDSTPTGQ